MNRRDALGVLAAAPVVAACSSRTGEPPASDNRPLPEDAILRTRPLGFPWETRDPFLFCVHHEDDYPEGDPRMGPAVSLSGRRIGEDFAGKDGFRMYHGEIVPGFPQHPHRGFETVTVARVGLID